MPELTTKQRSNLEKLKRAFAANDLEMAATVLETLQNLDTPALPLLDTLGGALGEGAEENSDLSVLIEDTIINLDEHAIPALAVYVTEDAGPPFLIDVAAEQLHSYDESDLLRMLRRAIRDRDERIREGAMAFLEELAEESEAAEALLDESDED